MGVCDTFDCTNGMPAVVIPNCGDVNFGQAIVKIFLAKKEASTFNDETDISSEGTWDTKLTYSVSGANKLERIVAIGDLYSGVKPATENETEQSPYGGDDLINRKHTITFEIRKMNRALIDSINQMRCFDRVKMWYLTEKGYLFGDHEGFQDVTIQWGGIEHAGIGNGRNKMTVTMTWNAIDDSEPLLLTFLKNKTN